MPNLLDLRKKMGSPTKDKLNFYIFYGDEHYLIYQYIDRFITVNNVQDIIKIDTVSEVLKKLNGTGLLKRKMAFIIKDDADFIKQTDKVWDNFLKNINGSFIFFIPYSIKSNSKFLKHFDDYVYKFDKMSETVLINHLQKMFNLNYAYSAKITEICDRDYNRILLEMDKVKCFADIEGIDNNTSFLYCYKNGVIKNSDTKNIYDLIDSICNLRVEESYERLNNLYGENKKQFIQNNALLIISLLNGIFKNILQLQLSKGSKDLIKTTGMNNWEYARAKKYAGIFSIGDLKELIRSCFTLELKLKSGKIDFNLSIEYLLLQIF